MTRRSRPRTHRLPRTAVAGLKGGVGKSTMIAQFAAALVARGLRVLVVELDPQGSTTYLITGRPVQPLHRHCATVLLSYARTPTAHRATAARSLVADAVLRADDPATGNVRSATHRAAWGPVHILPGHPDIGWLSIGQDGLLDLAHLLDALDGIYDAVLLDASPTISPLSLSGLYAADQVVAVTVPSTLSSQGLDQLFHLIGNVRRHHPVHFGGVIVNKERRRYRQRAYRYTELQQQLGSLLLSPVISEHTLFEDAEGAHLPVRAMGGALSRLLDSRFIALTDQLFPRRSR